MSSIRRRVDTRVFETSQLDLLPIQIKSEKISFDEEKHEYSLENTECANPIVFTSVTQVIHAYFNPFDEHEISKKTAARENAKAIEEHGMWAKIVTQQDVLDAWKAARTNGSKIHELIERHIKYGEFPPQKHQLRPHFDTYIQFRKDNPHLVKWHSEFRVFSARLKIAGTVDVIAYDTRLGGYVIIDWKCVKKIYKKSYTDMETPQSFGKKPLDEYEDCNFVHYSLQLETYKFLVENFYFEKFGHIVDKYLVWIKRDCSGYEAIRGLDLKREIYKIMASRVSIDGLETEDHKYLSVNCPGVTWVRLDEASYRGKGRGKVCVFKNGREKGAPVFVLEKEGRGTMIFDSRDKAVRHVREWFRM